ncbi:MAG: ferrous iron transport protein A [Leptospiraceae bacterium]|nr:ferrous iron transport protein A [Leptospiraceae bacterium]MDW8306105.1 FeoA family protein [Leptospiraceae bacterium]
MVRLSELALGEKGQISQIESSAIAPRLMELGFVPGEYVELKNKAPWGDPIEVSLLGYRLCLRRKDAEAVWVNTQ